MMTEMYEAACSEAVAYENDDYEEHTVESYMKENAALAAALATKAMESACEQVKEEEMTVETYEAMCESMKESYAKKMDEMKESFESVKESRKSILELYQSEVEISSLEEGVNHAEVIYESLFSIIARKKRMNDLLKKETDFKKKEKLKAELKGLSDDELKYKKAVSKITDAIKKHKESAKGKKLDDKAKFKYDKTLDKLNQKLSIAKGDESKAKGKFFKKRSF